MRMSPRYNREELKRGPWIEEEDEKLKVYVEKHGPRNWRALPKKAGLNRDGKSCRLRWINYLRPDIKHGKFSDEEESLITHLHSIHGNKWSEIARQLPGRTDNEIKNYFNTHIKKKLLRKGIDPVTHCRRTNIDSFELLPNLLAAAASINLGNLLMPNSFSSNLKLTDNLTQLAKIQLQNLLQSIQPNLFNPDILSLLSYYSLQNNQLGNTSPYTHCANGGVSSRETSELSCLQSMAFDPNSARISKNQPCSLTTSSSDDGSVWDKQLGCSYVPDDYSIPPLVSISPCNMVKTKIDPSVSSSTISTVNSSSSAMESIVSSPCEPWDLNHFLELENEDLGWKDILERISSSFGSSTPYQGEGYVDGN